MMMHRILIHPPGAEAASLECEHPETKLAEWLESRHFPLNTRCGGRGLCRGCLVEVDGRKVRACETPCGDVMEVRILEASLRDHRLNGISAFEVAELDYPLRRRAGIGLALDIGTTTLAGALWDLQGGTCLAHGSVANEQRRFGDNVLARIEHAMGEGGGSLDLQDAMVRQSLQGLLLTLCEEAGVPPDAIVEAVAAGNTVMQHCLAGVPLTGFAAYPFRPEFLAAQKLGARAVGFEQDFPIELAANLGPFVGADIAMGALASGMLERSGPALLIDFGTNGEILLKAGDKFYATATAAGPAFEGGRLNCGAVAGPGVVAGIEREAGGWKLRRIDTAGRKRAAGISGAAYVDFLALAGAEGILSPMGRLDPIHPAATR